MAKSKVVPIRNSGATRSDDKALGPWLFSAGLEPAPKPLSLAEKVSRLKQQPTSTRADQETFALALAEREDFFRIAEYVVWEGEDSNEFGELLRGLVLSMLPETRWDLEILATMAELQWKIRRLRRMQSELFHKGPKGYGNDGVLMRATLASSKDRDLSLLQEQLSSALKLYHQSRRTNAELRRYWR